MGSVSFQLIGFLINSTILRCIASIEETRVINEADVEEIPEKEQTTTVPKTNLGRSSVSSVCKEILSLCKF